MVVGNKSDHIGIMTSQIQDLEKRIQKIEERNKKVEKDKVWETSIARKVIIAILTYLIIVLFFLVNHLPNPYVNALVPTLGFILSTLTLNILKELWMKA